jgi:pimeloyl-ACP methyl ester carboxylesterase
MLSAPGNSLTGPHGTVWAATSGSGDHVILLHGIGSSSESFVPQLTGALSDRFSLYAWDAPGYGSSDDIDDLIDMNGYADIVTSFAGRLAQDGRRVHLVGVSWGGVIALSAVLSDPALFASVCVISSSAGSGVHQERARGMLARIGDLERLGPAAFAHARAPRLVSTAAPDEVASRAESIMARAIRLPGYRSAATAMAHTDLTPVLGEVSVPTLILAGISDRVTGTEAGRALFDAIPNAAYVPVPRAGHLINQERPRYTDALLAAFFEAA